MASIHIAVNAYAYTPLPPFPAATMVSHVPFRCNNAQKQRCTYAQALDLVAANADAIKGPWVLCDVHILDAYMGEFMAALKMRKSFANLVLMSASWEAAYKWAAYIDPSATITTTGLASPIEYALTLTDYLSPAPHVSSVAEICSWIVRRPQAPRGDVLIFGKSAAHRDELTRELTIAIGCWSPYTVRALDPHHTDLPSTEDPCILVATPALDVGLETLAARRIQHVVDFGKVYHMRQDTVDWEEGFISETMASRRKHTAYGGDCLRIYRDASVLGKEAIATHGLRHDLCKARILTQYGPHALHGFPVDLCADICTTAVAHLMSELRVEHVLASIMVHCPSLELGIGVAATVMHHKGPFHGLTMKTKPNHAAVAQARRWASTLGRSYRKIAHALHDTPWEDIVVYLERAYAKQIAVHSGHRNLFIHTETGHVLNWKYATPDVQAVIFLHRRGNEMVSCIPVSNSNMGNTLETTVVRSPVRFTHDLQRETVEAWFEARDVVAVVGSDTIKLLHLRGKKDLAVNEWTEIQTRHALERPLLVELGHGVNAIMTAGGRFSDCVQDIDFCLIEMIGGGQSQKQYLTKNELARLHDMSGMAYLPKNMLLNSRDLLHEARSTAKHVYYNSWKYGGTTFRPSEVTIRLVIKLATGKSTGRAVITLPLHEWKPRVPPQWTLHENIDLSEGTVHHPHASTLSGIPQYMDEIDLALQLQIDPDHVQVQRTVTIVKNMPCITAFFQQMDPLDLRPLPVRNRRGHIEFSLYVLEPDLPQTLHALHRTLPLVNTAVNQPLRVDVVMSISNGSHPPSSPLHPKRYIAHLDRASIRNDQRNIQRALEKAKQDAHDITPTFKWCPDLAAPWQSHGMHNVEQDGARLRLYGPPSLRATNEKVIDDMVPLSPSGKTYDMCPICMEPEAFLQLQVCGCRFCFACLAKTLDMKCHDPLFVDEFVCPSCKERVGTQDMELLINPTSLLTYTRRKAAFVAQRNPDMIAACPQQCGYFAAAGNSSDLACPVCDKEWCLKCSSMLRTPTPVHKGYCHQQWDTAFWKEFTREATMAGARACPQCSTFVVKDGGCNHLVCGAPRCQTHFCWKCTQAFSNLAHSPPAQGVIQKIDDTTVTIAVDASTWKPPCRTPLPTRPIVYSLDFATRMLLDPQKPLQENAKVWAWSYIYDHMENCLGETV